MIIRDYRVVKRANDLFQKTFACKSILFRHEGCLKATKISNLHATIAPNWYNALYNYFYLFQLVATNYSYFQ